MPETYPAKVAAHYAGLRTRMMLDYLERSNVFEREELRTQADRKRQHGVRRRYSYRDIVVLRAISSLLDKGVSVQRIRKAMLSFSRDEKFHCDRDRLRHGAEAVQYFVTDGASIFFSKGETLLDMVRGGQGTFSFVVDLSLAAAATAKVIPTEKKRVTRGR